MWSTVVVSRFTESRVPSRCAASTICCSVPGITFRCIYPLNLYLLRMMSTTLTIRSVVLEPVPATPELRNSPSTVCRSTSSLKVLASSSGLNPKRLRGTQWLFGQKWQSILQKSVYMTCMRFVNLPFGRRERYTPGPGLLRGMLYGARALTGVGFCPACADGRMMSSVAILPRCAIFVQRSGLCLTSMST